MTRTPNPEDDHLLDVHQAAAVLGVKPSTLYAWAHKRQIVVVKLSRNLLRFRREDLDRHIRKSIQKALNRKSIVEES